MDLSSAPNIAVFGGFMIDLTVFCERMPQPGETLIGRRFLRGFGGKGANQAAMSRFLGASCTMIGCLGDDDFGKDYRQHFGAEGISLALKELLPEQRDVSTGVAQITVTSSGENHIVTVAGANDLLSAADVTSAEGAIGRALDAAKVVLFQFEVPFAALEAGMKRAKAGGALIVLNTAPMPSDAQERTRHRQLLALADVVCANESEAAALCDVSGGDVDQWLAGMRALGCRQPLVTLGADGAAFLTEDGAVVRTSAPKVKALDTTGAGDCFLGCLAVLLGEGAGLEAAVIGASRVAAHSVTGLGTQSSFPRSELARRLISGEAAPGS